MLDLEVRSAQNPRLLLDVTMRHAIAGDAHRLDRAANDDGAVVKETEHDKHTRYPAARAPYKLVPLAVDTYGRRGREALHHLRLLAKRRAQALDGDGDSDRAASTLVLRWACRLSVALHRANAENLRKSLGHDVVRQRAELAAELAA